MKKIFNLTTLAFLLFSLTMWSCKKDTAEPELRGLAIEDNDLIQVTNANKFVPIRLTASDNKGISTIEASIATDNTAATVVATNTIRNMSASSLNGFVVNVPFPLPSVAPSGRYVATLVITDTNGNKTTKTYKLSILNYTSLTVDPCVFPNVALTGANNVLLRVIAPANTNGDDLFISGSFEGTYSGCSNWSGTGGCAGLKLTKVTGSNNCYYIQLNLDATSNFKVIRQSSTAWEREPTDANNNGISNITWNNQAIQEVTILNWKDRFTPAAITIPSGAIQTGKITLVVDVNSNDDTQPYYFVKQGATSLTGAIPGLRVVGTNRIAAAVPKEAGANYLVVRNAITTTGQNAYGYDKVFAIDGMTNPVNGVVSGFKMQFTPSAVPTSLFMVGGATPGGWNNPVPVPSQQFTLVSPGKFQIATIAITGANEILLLPLNGSWAAKYGASGSAPAGATTTGDVVPEGGNIKGPSVSGTYRIVVDFTLGTYTFTRL